MFVGDILKDMDTDPLPVRKRFVQMELEMTLAMFRAGVPFMAGTDTAAGVHIFPGFSLHQELALFVRARDSRRSRRCRRQRATRRSSWAASPTWGRSSPGSSPISCCSMRIRSRTSPTRARSARWCSPGRYFGRDDLDRMLAGVKRAAAEPDSPAQPAGST